MSSIIRPVRLAVATLPRRVVLCSSWSLIDVVVFCLKDGVDVVFVSALVAVFALFASFDDVLVVELFEVGEYVWEF